MSSTDGASFDWPNRVRPLFVPGLSSCLEEGRLTLDGIRIAATKIDVVALRLVEWAFESRRSLIICPPEPFGPLAAFTPAAAHVATMARYYERSGRQHALGSELRIAVVTSNLRVRGIYRRLGIGQARLFDVAPAATMSPSGEVSILGKDPGRTWSTIFLSRPSDLKRLERVDLAVVELPVEGQEELESLDLPLVLIVHDPADPMVLRIARDFPVFAWDDSDLNALSTLSIGGGSALSEQLARLNRVAEGTTCRVMRIPSQQVCENAALFWQDIGPLLRAGNRSLFARELAAAAFVLFYDLMHLAIPTAAYEAATRPIRIRISEVARAQRVTEGDLKDLYVPMVAAELEDLAASVGAESPKTRALLSLLRESVDRRREVLLVARTAELARTYDGFLQDFPELRGSVRLTSLWGAANESPADLAVIVGLLPTSARYLYTTGLAEEIVVLTYDRESTLQSVPGGFTEASQVQTAIAYQREFASWLARDAAKAACWERLSGEPATIPDDHPLPPRVDSGRVAFVDLPPPPDVPPDLWDGPFGSLAQLEDRLRRDAPPRLSLGEDREEGSILVESLRIDFQDGRWILLEVDAVATRYLPGRGLTEAGYPAGRIVQGDRLVFLDGEAKKDLLAKVVEVAGKLPEFAIPAAWVDYWRQSLRRAYSKFGTYERLRSELGRLGCVRETQTVRLWVVGQTIGPEDPDDIRRVGECLGDEPLKRSHREVNSAIESLRSAHRRLGHRVGALARQVGSATVAGALELDELIDERTGLTAADFRDSIEILEVRSVDPAGQVPYAVTGHLRAPGESEVEIV